MSNLTVFVNEQVVFEYDRSTSLSDEQLSFLDKMDADMDRGFRIFGEQLMNPDVQQKATFVVLNLIRALKQEDEAKIAVSCAYLSHRLPHAVEIHARDGEGRINVEFVDEH